MEEREFYLVLEGVCVGVHPLVRPNGGPPPLKIFDDLRVYLVDEPEDFGQPFASLIAQVRDHLVDLSGCAEMV
jgi:hypothetical protein